MKFGPRLNQMYATLIPVDQVQLVNLETVYAHVSVHPDYLVTRILVVVQSVS